MTPPLALRAYHFLGRAVTPALPAVLRWRLRRGKEDAARLGERQGFAGLPRPDGALAWLHGASIGETMSMLPLAARLIEQRFHVLITSGTVTSAELLAQRLPPGAMHQFVPLDAPDYAARFFAHWKPDIGIIAESELWPNLIGEAFRNGVKLVLVNARMSARSAGRWQRVQRIAGHLLSRFRLCLVQTAEDEMRFRALGAAGVQIAGNLKYDAAAPVVNSGRLAALRRDTAGRRVWLAASTHAGEEAIVLAAHGRLCGLFPDIITIIVPRHPQRGSEVAALAKALSVSVALRSAGEAISAATGVYVADSVGELGLFYSLAPVSFIGRSFARHGGQNPIEPARLESAVLHGPHVENFSEVYSTFHREGGAIEVADAEALARQIALLLTDESRRRQLVEGARRAAGSLGGATDRVMQALHPMLVEAHDRHAGMQR